MRPLGRRRRAALGAALVYAAATAQSLVRSPYARQRPRIAHGTVDPIDATLLGGVGVVETVLPAVYAATDRLDRWDYRIPRAVDRGFLALGTASLAAAVWLFARSHRDLGRNWQPVVGVGSDQTLVTDGVYRHIRHPMYTSQILLNLGQALVLPNWVAGMSGLLGFLALYARRVGREEKLMRQTFGEDYTAYCTRTGRLWPRLARP